MTDNTDGSSSCSSRMCQARRSGIEGLARQQETEGTGPAEQRYCTLEARAPFNKEGEGTQAEDRHAMATGAVPCGGKKG